MIFMQFLTQGQLKPNYYVFFMQFLAQGQLKTNFSHPMSYDLAVVDGISTNSATTVERHWKSFVPSNNPNAHAH